MNGYTGSRHEPVGVVHPGEFLWWCEKCGHHLVILGPGDSPFEYIRGHNEQCGEAE